MVRNWTPFGQEVIQHAYSKAPKGTKYFKDCVDMYGRIKEVALRPEVQKALLQVQAETSQFADLIVQYYEKEVLKGIWSYWGIEESAEIFLQFGKSIRPIASLKGKECAEYHPNLDQFSQAIQFNVSEYLTLKQMMREKSTYDQNLKNTQQQQLNELVKPD